jgi:hypothetical protein
MISAKAPFHNRQCILTSLYLLKRTRVGAATCCLFLGRPYFSCLRSSRLAEAIASRRKRHAQDEEAAQPRSEALNGMHANSCLRDQEGSAIRMVCAASQRIVSPLSARHSAQSHSRYSDFAVAAAISA